MVVRAKALNYIRRVLVLCFLFVICWEIYAVGRYREVLFFSRFMRGEGYAFTEYFLFLVFALLFYGILSSAFDRPVYRTLKDGWEEFKEIWSDIVRPLGTAKYTTALSVLFLSIYGYQLFNFTLSLDEEVHMAGFKENASWCHEGRFSITVLKDFLMEFGMYQPCLSNLLGDVLLLLAGLCIFSLISKKLTRNKPDKYLSLVFLAGFLSFPTVIAESQSFSTYCVEISFGMFCTALAVVYLDRYFMTGKGRNLVLNILLLAFSLGIYQSMAELYISLVMIYFLVSIFNEKDVKNRKAVIYLRKILLSVLFFVLSLVVFYLAYKIATSIHRVESSIEYINGFSEWDLEYGVFASLFRSIEQLIVTLSQTQIPGIKYFTYYTVLGVLLTIFFLIAYPNLKGAFCGGLILLITISGYFIWVGLAATSLPFRAWLASPVVCGFLYFMAAYIMRTKFSRKYYIICHLVIAVVLFHQIQTINELFYNDHIRMEKDITFARELYHDICYETGVPNAETPIVFIGSVNLGADDAIIKNPYAEKYFGANCLGYSFWRRAQEPQRMQGLYDNLGYTLNIQKCSDRDMIVYSWSNMTVYPQKGSIISKDGVVYVRLR